MVTGGNNAEKTSIYKEGEGWVPGPDMNIPRGYHASATTSTGDVRCRPLACMCAKRARFAHTSADVFFLHLISDADRAVAHLCVF